MTERKTPALMDALGMMINSRTGGRAPSLVSWFAPTASSLDATTLHPSPRYGCYGSGR